MIVDRRELLRVVRMVGLILGGVVAIAAILLGGALASGKMNMQDVYSRVPRPVAAWLVEDPDEVMRLQCDGLDERDPQAVEALAAKHGLTVVYEPADAEIGALRRVDWIYWRDRLVATIAAPDEELPSRDPRVNGACPG